MSIKAVIFDLDGVIVSTDDYHYEGWEKITDEERIYFDREINEQLRGVSRMESLVVEDEDAGVEAALACGMKMLGVGFASNNERCNYSMEYLYRNTPFYSPFVNISGLLYSEGGETFLCTYILDNSYVRIF